MTKWLMAVGIILLGSVLAVPDAEARRIGGGRTVGAQRNVTAPPAQAPAKAAPSQQQNAAQAAPAQRGSRWLPILGGLALGGILGYLFGGSGVLGFLLLALLAVGAVLAVRALMQRRSPAPQPVQYAGMRETVDVTPSGTTSPAVAEKTHIPAGFDTTGFLRGAKMNFLRLQSANDAGRLDEIRELTTTELYEELKKDAADRSPTEVNGLEAQLLEVVTEGDQHWASVRFWGTVRESPEASPQTFAEVWNLVKPANGSTGWLLAGIQQMH
jgi:predicted lipid-binding transport protein (Tim44 family)